MMLILERNKGKIESIVAREALKGEDEGGMMMKAMIKKVIQISNFNC